MSDPLVDLYKASFAREHPARRFYKTHHPLPDAELKRMSVAIQSTGIFVPSTIPAVDPIRADPVPLPQGWSPPQASLVMPEIFSLFRRLDQESIDKLPTQKTLKPTMVTLATRAPTASEQLANEKRRLAAQLDKVGNIWEPVRVEETILFELYEAMVEAEYEALSKSKAQAAYKEFETKKKPPKGLQLYRDLRPVYYREKVREPHKFIMQMIDPSKDVTIGGEIVNQGMHPVFAEILKEVEKSVNQQRLKQSVMGQPDAKPVDYVGCFRPSTIGMRASNHMLGAAIDIDSRSNPHLKGKAVPALEAMLIYWAEDQHKKNPLNKPEPLKLKGSWLAEIPNLDDEDAATRADAFYAKTVEISKQTKSFLDDHLEDWVLSTKSTPAVPPDAWKQKAFEIVKEMVGVFEGGVKRLRAIRSEGFISVPAELFRALASHKDLQWGLYTNVHPNEEKKRGPSLDVMHFEVKPSVKKSRIIGPNGFP